MNIFAVVLSQNGTDYGLLVRQNSELLRALDELEKSCNTLREENGLLVGLKITVCVCVPLMKSFVETRPGPQNTLKRYSDTFCSFFYRNLFSQIF